MSPRLRRPVLVALVAALALVGAALPAKGAPDTNLASGGNPPGGWLVDPSIYESMFGGVGAGAPQGTVVADSGFRPYPHGFPVPNWGTAESFAQNSLVYGLPTRITLEQLEEGEYEDPAPLNSLALRRTLGDGVCRDAKSIDPKTGQCDLILGAELLAQVVENFGLSGHCFGMAAAAAALYNGQLPANQVGASGLGINGGNQMGNPAVQTITRLMIPQFLGSQAIFAGQAGQSPTKIVQTLIQTLPSGTVPFVLSMIGQVGGHAITPYAVLDRGAGIYDIAVYDNNYPLRALAVTVDTNTDSFVYTSATNPNSPTYTWSTENASTLHLVGLDGVLDVQPCPVCRGKDQGTMVAFSALAATNAEAITVMLLDMKGQPLATDRYRALPSLNPPTEENISAPVYIVYPGVDFLVAVNTGKLATPQSMEVYALSNGASEYLLLDELSSNTFMVFGVEKDKAVFQSDKVSSPRIQQLYDGRTTSYDVNGHPLLLPKEVIASQEWNKAAQQVRYSSTAKRALDWNVQVTGIRNSGEAGWVAIGVSVPAGGEILVDYSRASATTAPMAWVIAKDKTRTPLTMQKVTPALLEQYRDEVYVTQGPS
jgi:hypothetical protein